MRRLIVVAVLALLATLACGVQALPTVTETPKTALPTVVETEKPLPTVFPSVLATVTDTPKLLAVAGCWNVREQPSFGSRVVRVQCGGDIQPLDVSDGWIRVTDGYICARSIGIDARCD
jgi:hypothetical protein